MASIVLVHSDSTSGRRVPRSSDAQVFGRVAKPGQRQFRGRQDADFAHSLARALGVRIERPDGFDLVTEEVEPNGFVPAGWEEIQDAAPAGNLTRFGDERRQLEPVFDCPAQQLVLRHPVASAQLPRRGSQRRPGA